MKTLDRYVVRSFLYSYMLCFLVLIGLRVTADLFINMDEFAELDLAFSARLAHVGGYYLYNSLVYFRELGGLILVAAAGFSLARMNHTNELTAILASGVSLHRVLWPVALVTVALSTLSVVNQEVLIPRVKNMLVRDRDDVPGSEIFEVRPLVDDRRSVWYSTRFAAGRMSYPLILLRDADLTAIGKIGGLDAVYTRDGKWRVREAVVALVDREGVRREGVTTSTVRTRQSPKALAAAEATGAALGGGNDWVGVRITARRIVAGRDILIEPRFEILAQLVHPAGLAKAPVLATVVASAACYGRLSDAPGDWGYRLMGPSELKARDIRDWGRFCRKLNADRQGGEDHPGKRLWNKLPGALRYAIVAAMKAEDEALARGKKIRPGKRSPGELSDRDKAEMLKALNAIIKQSDFFHHPAADAVGAAPSDFRGRTLTRADRELLAYDREKLPGLQIARLNRLVLDLYYPGAIVPSQGVLYVETDLTPTELALRRDSRWLEYLSTSEINALLGGGKISDPARATLIKHSRVTSPLTSLLMLLVAIPSILSRQRNIRASAFWCVTTVAVVYILTLVCSHLGEAGVPPAMAAWLPILIVGPVAALRQDAMKT